MVYQTIKYGVDGRIATITLNRPERLNAINLEMPGEIAAAVDAANRDDAVHVIVLTGAGDGFCSGYDLKDFAEATGERPGSQLGGGAGDARAWDPMADFFGMYEFTQQFMSLWRSYKPTIGRVHGPAVAGGSDQVQVSVVVEVPEVQIGDSCEPLRPQGARNRRKPTDPVVPVEHTAIPVRQEEVQVSIVIHVRECS